MPSDILRTESNAEFDKLRADFEQDLNPANSIERQYVDEIVHYTRNIKRYERVKTAIWNNALGRGLAHLLNETLLPPSENRLDERLMASRQLSYEWLIDPTSERKIATLLAEAQRDGSAIDAEAFKLVADDLKNASQMLEFERKGRDKAFGSIAKYRKTFAAQLRQKSDRELAAGQAPIVPNDVEN